MKNFAHLGLVAIAFGAAGCDTLTDDTSDTDPVRVCMEDLDGDDRYDVYPASGALSAGDYAGCEVYTGPVLVSHFPQPSCSAAQWDYEFETQGWASGGILYSLDTAGGNANEAFWWDEKHDLSDGNSEPNEWWDQYTLTLPVVDDFNNQVDSTNSYHQCAANDNATLVWGLELYSFDDPSTVVDCITISGSTTSDAWIGDLQGRFTELAGCDTFRWSDQ